MDKFKVFLHKLIFENRSFKRTVFSLAVIVVFVTTYLLILPAFTLSQKQASEQGGIDVPEAVLTSEDANEHAGNESDATVFVSDNDEPGLNDVSSDAQVSSAAGLVYEGEGYTITVDDSSSPLPADTQLAVTEIIKEEDSKEYMELLDKADEAVRTEEGIDINKTQRITFAKFYDITFMSEGKEIVPDPYDCMRADFDRRSGYGQDTLDEVQREELQARL